MGGDCRVSPTIQERKYGRFCRHGMARYPRGVFSVHVFLGGNSLQGELGRGAAHGAASLGWFTATFRDPCVAVGRSSGVVSDA